VSAIAGTVIRESDAAALAARMAGWIADCIQEKQGRFRIALSGGETPKTLYKTLASNTFRTRIDWQRLDVFWGDERFVPYSDPRSNFAMARDALLCHVPIPPSHIHPMPVDGTPEDAAARYEMLLKELYGSATLDSAQPLFDLVLLGLGSDGHTASLLPGQPVLDEKEKWVAAVEAGREEPRLTLTYPVLENNARIAFLVTGKDKADAVKHARASDITLPAGRLRPSGAVLWFLDGDAADLSAAP
jgi:6-phosphogluconolactonase